MSLTLSRWQSDVFTSLERFRVMIAGRRSGKTHLMRVELLSAAVKARNQNCCYLAPTWGMAKDLMWGPLKELVPRNYLASRPSESELMIELINGSKIVLRSADNPDRMRGWGFDFVAPDEFAFMDWIIWKEVLLPSLADRQGRALFGTTPKGLNHAFDLFNYGRDDSMPEWRSWQVTTLQGGRVSPSEVELARRNMDPRTFKQEYEASFEALGGRVYDYFDMATHVRSDIKDNGGDLLVGLDFNVNPMSAVLATAAGPELHVFDELAVPASNTTEVAQELRRRYPDRSIIVCPDPSGNARKTSAVAGQTDFTILKSFGMQIDAPSAAPAVVDRVNATQAMLRSADNQIHLYMHPRCTRLIRAQMGQIYKEGTSIPAKDGFDHPNDALGYLVWQRFNRIRAGWSSTRVRF